MTIQERVRQFIQTNFLVQDPASLREDTSLLAESIVDSTGMLEVIVFLEADFGLQVPDTDVTPENFETIGRIAAYIERKVAAPAATG